MTWFGRSAGHRVRRARDQGDHRTLILALFPVAAVVAWGLGRVLARPLALAVLPPGPETLLIGLGVVVVLVPAAAMAVLLRLDRPAPVRLERPRLVLGAVATLALAANGVWVVGLRREVDSAARARFGDAYERVQELLVGVGAGLLLVIAGGLVLWWLRRRAARSPRQRRPAVGGRGDD